MNRVAVLFPGQGAQYVGMGKSIYDYPVVKRKFEEASEVIGLDIRKLSFEGPNSLLKQTVHAQPAVVTVSVAAFELLRQEADIVPAFSAGHSLGEYTALICSGVLSFREGIEIVKQRGLLMQDAAFTHPGTMIAVTDIAKAKLDAWCQDYNDPDKPLVIACCNTERQHVIAGHHESIERLLAKLDGQSVRYSKLQVSGPFHSPMMKQAADRLVQWLHGSSMDKPKWPVISNVDVSSYTDADSIMNGLIRQMTLPVRWHETMEYMIRQGVNWMIEVGPGRVLSNMLKNSGYYGEIHSLDNKEDLADIVKKINDAQRGTQRANWDQVEQSLVQAVMMRNRSLDPDEFHKGVIEPNNQVRNLLMHNDELSTAQTRQAMAWIQQIIETKNNASGKRIEVHM